MAAFPQYIPWMPLAIEILRSLRSDNKKLQSERELESAQESLRKLERAFGALEKQTKQLSEEEKKRHEEEMTALREQLEAASTEAKRMRDPEHFASVSQDLFNGFLSHLKSLDFSQTIPRAGNEKHYGAIGSISSGKTTLANVLFQLDFPTGVGEVTKGSTMVYASKEVGLAWWDCQGKNDDWSYYDTTTLSFFKSLDHVFITFCDSVRSCDQIIKLVYTLRNGEGISLLRTKCDLARPSDIRTIEEEVAIDMQILREWGTPLPVYPVADPKTSSRFSFDYVKRVMGLCTL